MEIPRHEYTVIYRCKRCGKYKKENIVTYGHMPPDPSTIVIAEPIHQCRDNEYGLLEHIGYDKIKPGLRKL